MLVFMLVSKFYASFKNSLGYINTSISKILAADLNLLPAGNVASGRKVLRANWQRGESRTVQLPLQESLANAKVSAQLRVCRPLEKKCTANQRKERNVKKNIQWVSTLSLTIHVYLHSFSCCCLRNVRNPTKFSENSIL